MGRRFAAMITLAIAAMSVSPLIADARAPETSTSNSESAIGALPSTTAAAAALGSSARVAALRQMVADSGASVGITVVELGGASPATWTAFAGASNSEFFMGNTTTAEDLAVLWVAEAKGELGGAAAQAWLYPLLTGTTTEQGVPAGVPAGSTVVHKTGTIDAVVNDAALVASGPDGPYVLVVTTDGLGGASAWELIASVSALVWQAEESRL